MGKRANYPSCGDCGSRLGGIPACRPRELHSLRRRQRTVSRAYGGSRCGKCVKQRIVRAFLIEEQKIVKHVLRTRASTAKSTKTTKTAPTKKPAAT